MHPITPLQQRFLSGARMLYVIGLVLALILIIPTSWFPFQVAKIAALTTCFALAALCLIAADGMHLWRSKATTIALTILSLPVAFLISWYGSIDRSVGMLGLGGLEISTVFFTALAFLTLLGASLLFRSQRSTALLFNALFGAFILAAIFQLIAVIFGTNALPFQTFTDRSVNLIGKWNDLGLLLGILVLWSVIKLEWTALSRLHRILLVLLLLAVGILLDLIHFPVVWALLCGFSVLFIAARYILPHASRSIPWYAGAVAVISILFLVFGTPLNTNLSKIFPVTSLEVRPSYQATANIITAAHPTVSRALIGSGPNTFRQEWFVNRPAEVNLSPFWNLDFTVGYSTLLTLFADAGLLGAAAWLLPLFLTLLSLFRLVRSSTHTDLEKLIGTTIAVGAVYLWIASWFYVLSQDVVLLAFVLTGVLIGMAYGETVATRPASRLALSGMWVGTLLFFIATVGVAYAPDRLFLSDAYANQGLAALSAGNTQKALADAARSAAYQRTPSAFELAAQAHLSQLQALAAASSTQTTAQQNAFIATAQQAIGEAKEASMLDPQDYQPYALLGQIYSFLASLNVQGAYSLAQNTYALAAQKDPTNPEIPLLQAQLAGAANNMQEVQNYLQQSLTLKQNFTNAILTLVQLDIAQKDIKNAIVAAQAAVQSAPSVPSVWFELGLLYYSEGDTTDAIQPLEQAVKLQGNYANAEYFLGLSYYAQGKTAQAIQLFSNLAATNPDNQEVALILSNMQAGKSPFTSAKPPISTPPQRRATAPISE